MLSSNFVKNIISKDKNTYTEALKALINSKDTILWEELISKADFIFPFVKEKIINDFVKNINCENLDNVYILMKKYSPDFEDIVVKSLVKFANEDVTDNLLEIFENGIEDEKIYAAKYFSFIKDPLALEYLKKGAYSENVYLKANCAKALLAFNDTEILIKMKDTILKSDDDFEKLSAFEFVSVFESEIKFVLENLDKTPFKANVISNILDNKTFLELKNILNENYLTKIFHILIDSYPEDITLDTIIYYDILEFIKYVSSLNSNYARNLLLFAKVKFEEFLDNENYNFDLDKNTKTELKAIADYLRNINLDANKLQVEFSSEKINEYNLILDIIREYNLLDKLAEIRIILDNSKEDVFNEIIGNTAQLFYQFNKIGLLDKSIIDKINNNDLKALVQSYFN